MGLEQNLRSEEVGRLPAREAITLPVDASVALAASRMRDAHMGCVIAVDSQGMPVGVFTERTLTRLLLEGVPLDQTSLADHLEAKWKTVSAHDSILRVYEAVKERLRFVCVLDDEGRVAGLTGQRGLCEYIAEHFPKQVLVQRLGAKPAMQKREGA